MNSTHTWVGACLEVCTDSKCTDGLLISRFVMFCRCLLTTMTALIRQIVIINKIINKIVLIYFTSQGSCYNNSSLTPVVLVGNSKLCKMPLTGSTALMECCWESVYVRLRLRAKKMFVEKQQSTVHNEVINICMTEQMMLISMVTHRSVLRCQTVMVSAVV